MPTKEVTKQKHICFSWETWRYSGDKGISLKILNRKIFLQTGIIIVRETLQDLFVIQESYNTLCMVMAFLKMYICLGRSHF